MFVYASIYRRAKATATARPEPATVSMLAPACTGPVGLGVVPFPDGVGRVADGLEVVVAEPEVVGLADEEDDVGPVVLKTGGRADEVELEPAALELEPEPQLPDRTAVQNFSVAERTSATLSAPQAARIWVVTAPASLV